MNVTIRPTMTRDQFLDWAERQEERYEFDGTRPIPMTGGSRNHSLIVTRLAYTLLKRLDGTEWNVLVDAGLATVGDKVRYPDVQVTRTKAPGSAKLIPGAVVVFEVLSPSSVRADRVEKLQEYAAVPSILRYVVLEQNASVASIASRVKPSEVWQGSAAGPGAPLELPELGISIPMDEVYYGADLTPQED